MFFYGKNETDDYQELSYPQHNALSHLEQSQSEDYENKLKIKQLFGSTINEQQTINSLGKIRKNNIEIIYTKPRFPSKNNLQMFADMLTTFWRQTILTNNELPLNKNFEDQFFRYVF